MSPMLIAAIVTITLALIFYSVGVIGEAKRGLLLKKDAVWFAVGLLFDAIGTSLMSSISSSGNKVLSPWASTLMSISGTLAIILMAIHLIFAIVLLAKNKGRETFHKYSLMIYGVWLISYFVGPLGLMFS